MPSPALLDFDALTAPVPGADPAGGSIPFAVKEKLEESRKEVDPSTFDPKDPTRPTDYVKADWAGIVRLAQETLIGTSKNLLVSARLTEALAKQHRFAGLRDGLHLMLLLVDQCWDRLNPAVEGEDDLEIRAAPFFWLDDTDRGARFPEAIRQLPMVGDGQTEYGWLTWKQIQSGKANVKQADFEKAVQTTPRDRCQELFDDLTQSWQDLDALSRALASQMGGLAPGFSGLRQALGDCRELAQQILERKGPPPPTPGAAAEEGDGAAEEGAPGAPGAPGREQAIPVARYQESRAKLYQRLGETAAMLQQLEPHSPIPFLIQKAIELGALPFPELMKVLVRNPDVLAAMNRELGIKEGEPAKP